MNKKVLTLCAGFLLAGGMLSSLSAVELTQAEPGKYYKLVRAAYLNNSANNQWTPDNQGFYLELDENGDLAIDKNAANGVDYWKLTPINGDVYQLTNFAGESVEVTLSNSEVETDKFYTELKTADGTKYYFIDYDGGSAVDQYTLVQKTAGEWSTDETLYSTAFDAIPTSLKDVNLGLDRATLDLDGENVTFKFIIGDYAAPIIYKATYDKENNSYSFANNATGETIYFTDATNGEREKDVTIVPCENGMGSFLQLPSGGKYVAIINGEFSLVDSWDKATMFGFQITNTRVAVSVDVLNYYEKDGFSVEINGYDTKGEPTVDLDGNPFTGHLTPMVLVSESGKNVFKKAADQTNVDVIKEYYLKDEAGNYIVATKYDVEGEISWQALYNFKTVSEADLLHNIARARNNQLDVDQIYFGLFRASVDEAALDEDKTALDEITWLEVNIDPYDMGYADGYYYAELGRADIKDVPTLVATNPHLLTTG